MHLQFQYFCKIHFLIQLQHQLPLNVIYRVYTFNQQFCHFLFIKILILIFIIFIQNRITILRGRNLKKFELDFFHKLLKNKTQEKLYKIKLWDTNCILVNVLYSCQRIEIKIKALESSNTVLRKGANNDQTITNCTNTSRVMWKYSEFILILIYRIYFIQYNFTFFSGKCSRCGASHIVTVFFHITLIQSQYSIILYIYIISILCQEIGPGFYMSRFEKLWPQLFFQ